MIQLKMEFETFMSHLNQCIKLHMSLFEKTSEEYIQLLEGDHENLGETIKIKQGIIHEVDEVVSSLERSYFKIFNLCQKDEAIFKLENLKSLLSEMNLTREHKYLSSQANLLAEIVDNTKEQNKLNQSFINKSIESLKSLKRDVFGIKEYNSYNNKGIVNSHISK